jgi:hypothetical protein
MPLDPGYDLKARQPLADTSTLPQDDPLAASHWTKLTPRLIPSLLLHLAVSRGRHPYLPATVGGLVLLAVVLRCGAVVSGDRLVGFGCGLTVAGTYAVVDCFAVTYGPKPFDGVALGFVALTLLAVTEGSAVVGSVAAGLLACGSLWCDERAVLSLLVLGLFVAWHPGLDRRARRRTGAALVAGVVAYVLSRMAVARALGWTAPVTYEIARSVLPFTVPLAGLTIWSALEGGIFPAGVLAWRFFERRAWRDGLTWVGTLVAGTVACLVVLDLSRAGAYLFPLVPTSVAGLVRQGTARPELRAVVLAGAAVSLLAPTFDILAGVAYRWSPPWTTVLLVQFFGTP